MFKIGDKVKVIRQVKCYYRDDARVAEVMELTRWCSQYLTHYSGRCYTVVGKTFRPDRDAILVAIDDGVKQFIVDEDDLSVCPSAKVYSVKYTIEPPTATLFSTKALSIEGASSKFQEWADSVKDRCVRKIIAVEEVSNV